MGILKGGSKKRIEVHATLGDHTRGVKKSQVHGRPTYTQLISVLSPFQLILPQPLSLYLSAKAQNSNGTQQIPHKFIIVR